MAEPFLAELRIVSFNYAPRSWALANGQLLPINQNQALFSLLGTTYGGNGVTTFALPNLQGRAPMHFSSQYPLGQQDGAVSCTLNVTQIPTHVHTVQATTNAGTEAMATETLQFAKSNAQSYGSPPLQNMAVSAITSYGANQPHENRQPFLVLSFCIALQGIFPSRN
jgi:microcystin-dependent protein